MNEYVFFLDLINDEELITQYDQWHKEVWPEVELQILNSGLTSCRIYRVSNRLVLIANSKIEIDWTKKAVSDLAHAPTVEWENLMWKFQKAIPGSAPEEKWRMAELIYKLEGK